VTAGAPARGADAEAIGPPLFVLALGFLSVVVSLPLARLDGMAQHVVGYLVGGLVPIVVVGVARRLDLERRRSPKYQARTAFRLGSVALLVAAIVAAGIHLWPIATELAS